MEDASADVTSELLDALLSGTNSKKLEDLACDSQHSCKLLAAVCGLRFPALETQSSSALKVALSKLLDDAVKPDAKEPLQGTLQTLPPLVARQVMIRVSKLYTLVVGRMVSAESKSVGAKLSQLLMELQLMSGTPLRSLRQASSAAAFGALQALFSERLVAHGALEELEKQKAALINERDGDAASRLARLCRGSAQVETLVKDLDVEVARLQEVLKNRIQDTAAIIRRFSLQQLGRYMQQKFLWVPERVLRCFGDPAPEVRLQAIEIAASWFEGDLDDALALEVSRQLYQRRHDTDPRVASAAVRHLRMPSLVALLPDEHFQHVALLSLTAPDSHGLLRVEAALFVEQHLLPEPGLGIATKKPSAEAQGDDLERQYTAEHGLISLSDFLSSYLANNDQLHLARRFVEALWLRSDCFRCWATVADLCLLGEGQGAARHVPCLPIRQRLALMVVLDSALKCAEVPSDALETLVPRLPRLFELFAAEGLCYLDVLASISKRLICAACQRESEAPLPRVLLPSLLAALQHGRINAQLQLAEALVAWAERSSEVQAATRKLVVDFYSSLFPKLARGEILDMGPVLALGQRGVDLWSCDQIGWCNKILSSAVSVLDAWANGQPGDGTGATQIAPRNVSELLQLLVLLCCWRARSLLGEATESSGFLMWCHLLRSSCSKVMEQSQTTLLRLEAFSCYFLLLHLEFLGYKDTQALPKVPEQHLQSIDATLRDFYANSSQRAQESTCPGWCQAASELGGREVTISRWLIDRYLREADGTEQSSEEVQQMVASSASRMLAECQHELIYSSAAAERLLQQLGQQGDGKGTECQAAALHLLSRLRVYGGRSVREASQGYQLQFRAAARHAQENGLDAGLQLASTFIHWSTPPIIAGSRAATSLGKGLAEALKLFLERETGGRGPTELEVLVPWLRDAGCPLPGPTAQKLATQLAADFGLLGQSITAHPQKRPRPWRLQTPPGVWPLVTALQGIGSRLQRSQSWQAKMQETAKRRLAKRKALPVEAPRAVGGWLTPLEKKGDETGQLPVKRKREEPIVARSVAPLPAKRQWQLRDD